MAHVRQLRNFSQSESGSALIMVSMAAFLLLAAAGMAIDLGRVQVVQSRLSSALDSAGLAAGTVANSGNIQATTIKYFNANFPASYMGSTIQTPTIVPNNNNSIFLLDVQGTVPMTFMKLFGINTMSVSAHSEVTRANLGMELVLVFDVTGSMNNNISSGLTKLQAAKNASNTLLDILYGTSTSLPNLWVGLVPFSQAVNVGNSAVRDGWTAQTAFNWGPSPSAWMGCVESRAGGGLDVTDTAPNIGNPATLFPKYYSPCNSDTGSNDEDTNAWHGTNSSSSGGNPQWGNCQFTGGGTTTYRTPLDNTNRGPNLYCPQALTPMSKAKSTIVNAVSTLTAQGSTEIVLGMSWAWRLLSPNWRNIWSNAGTDADMIADQLPKDYNTPLMNKVVVLLTDGDNDIAWDRYTAYGYPTNTSSPPNQFGINPTCATGGSYMSNCSAAETVLNNRTQQVCSAMKANGILIYTVGFGTNISSNGLALLQGCASKPEYYFYSPTGSSLQAAFQTIGDALANLRISQ